MRLLIFFSLTFIGFGSGMCQQSKQTTYILIRLFTDSQLTERDSVTKVEVASLEGNILKDLERKNQYVFLSHTPSLKQLQIRSGDNLVDFEIPPRALRSSFIVIDAYLNPGVTATNASVNAYSGDVVYAIKKCSDACHRIRIRNASVIIHQNDHFSTGYPELDPFVLN